MKVLQKRTGDPIRRVFIFLVLRFVVFTIIALAVHTSVRIQFSLAAWAALGYFALSEIFLLAGSTRRIQQGIVIGVYFLDSYAVSSLLLMQDLPVLWYLVMPLLIMGVTLCYHPPSAWLVIGTIPSLFIIFQLRQTSSQAVMEPWELTGIVILFFSFAAVFYYVVTRAEAVFSLVRGQRRLVHRVSSVIAAPSVEETMVKALNEEPPLVLDFAAILLQDGEGNMEGRERVGDGEVRAVRLGNQRIPSVLGPHRQRATYAPSLRKSDDGNDFFRARNIECLITVPLRAGESEGVVIFGRQGRNAFPVSERELLMSYAEVLSGWMGQAHSWEQVLERQDVADRPTRLTPKQGTAEGESRCGELERRVQRLEQEKGDLRKALDDQLGANTHKFKERILSLASREAEMDQKVVEKLATAELSQAVSMLFDLDLTLNLILDVVCERLSVDTASIMLVREETEDLVVQAYRGLQDEVARKTRLMVGEAIAGYVAQKGEPLLIEDIEKDPRFVPFRRERYRSGTLLSVPIVHEKRVVGVINLANPLREGPFTKRDLDVLQALSRQAAIAIWNHRLYQEFENGEWIRDLYTDGLSQKLTEKVFRETGVLEDLEGESAVTVLAIQIHEANRGDPAPGVPERIRRMEDNFQKVREQIVRYRGDVAGENGAGIIGIFGMPFSDPGDPWRAVLAAVDLLKVFSGRNNGFGVSVGVASGQLLFRQKKGSVPYGASGEAWDRGMTLMQAGSPGQILVDEETFDRVQDRVNGLRLVLPYGIQKQLVVYGIKGLKRQAPEI